jgi:hypothetical protein
MDLERTEVGNQDFRQHTDMARLIMQQVIAENPYAPDMQWSVWHAAHELEETNGLPHGVSAEDIFQHYLRVFEGE